MKINYILKQIVLLFIGFFILGGMWFLYIMFNGGFGMSFEVSGNRLTKTYLKVGDYKVGKQKWFYNICHKEKGCLNGELLGFKNKNNDIYIYIYIYIKYGTIIISDGQKYYDYELYKNNTFESINIDTLDNLPKYGYLNGNNLEFYSENDLKKLDEKQQQIFKELEKNPTLIINGIDYTKK